MRLYGWGKIEDAGLEEGLKVIFEREGQEGVFVPVVLLFMNSWPTDDELTASCLVLKPTLGIYLPLAEDMSESV